jgi:hypothetical protein
MEKIEANAKNEFYGVELNGENLYEEYKKLKARRGFNNESAYNDIAARIRDYQKKDVMRPKVKPLDRKQIQELNRIEREAAASRRAEMIARRAAEEENKMSLAASPNSPPMYIPSQNSPVPSAPPLEDDSPLEDDLFKPLTSSASPLEAVVDAEAAEAELEIQQIVAKPGWSAYDYFYAVPEFDEFKRLRRNYSREEAFKKVALDLMKKHGPNFLKSQKEARIARIAEHEAKDILEEATKKKEKEDAYQLRLQQVMADTRMSTNQKAVSYFNGMAGGFEDEYKRLSITLGEEEAFKTVALNLLRKHGREFLTLPDESRILAAQAAEREQKMVEEAKAAAERKQKMVDEAKATDERQKQRIMAAKAEAAAAAATLPSPLPFFAPSPPPPRLPAPERELQRIMMDKSMSTIKKAQRYFYNVDFTSLDGKKTESAISLFSKLKKNHSDEQAFEEIALILMKHRPDFFESRDQGDKSMVDIKTDEVPYKFDIIPY